MILLFCVVTAGAQTISDCKKRFDTYLNFKHGLTNKLVFEKEVIYLLNQTGEREIALYDSELQALAAYTARAEKKTQQQFFQTKGLRHFTRLQLDSLLLTTGPEDSKMFAANLPLAAYRIAIDPGHFGTNLKEAAAEQKYLYFGLNAAGGKADSVKLFESKLTFATAKILQGMLEEQGANVMLTRTQDNFTSFDCSYSDWLKRHKQRCLDSLKSAGAMPSAKYTQLVKSKDHAFFWDFFRDYELSNRVTKVNAFKPDLTVIIHYNVDEKNAPWKKTSNKNFTMTFIGGAFTANDLSSMANKTDFIRLLITNQLNQSEKLAQQTVLNFNNYLGIRIAKPGDAEYLANNCNATPSDGVFSRNLALCRKINSPLVYGEALYQDNESECTELMKTDVQVKGLATNKRIQAVATAYYRAISDVLKKK